VLAVLSRFFEHISIARPGHSFDDAVYAVKTLRIQRISRPFARKAKSLEGAVELIEEMPRSKRTPATGKKLPESVGG